MPLCMPLLADERELLVYVLQDNMLPGPDNNELLHSTAIPGLIPASELNACLKESHHCRYVTIDHNHIIVDM
ncbi:hypothetical protein CEXT_189821 [Caerostris extrusa]|uniref:Uncharacterized protein n=1 Tax=Caerostris extrusa TaxID=172846 RepID=A0AAV4MZ61_CAEEX|nr:hypothetical protein CEXT_189821 [Caerostris extrusa]